MPKAEASATGKVNPAVDALANIRAIAAEAAAERQAGADTNLPPREGNPTCFTSKG